MFTKKQIILTGIVFTTALPLYCASFAGTVYLPETGQKTSYRSGDDGDLERGVAWPSPRFTDNGNGTVTDDLTGLAWLKDANCIGTRYPSFDYDYTYGDGRVKWQHGLDFVKGINNGTYSNCGAGYSDWRLPNRKELRSLIDYSNDGYGPALPTGHPFTNVQSNYYWSSSTFAYKAYTDGDWIVDMWGGVSYDFKYYGYHYVWPVRSGQVGGSFDYYCDSDSDGYISSAVSGTCAGAGCEPSGCQTTPGDDCNDSDAAVHPAATEVCDGIDNNCDGQIDEGFDNDGDGYTTCGGDCDDNDPAIHPGATDTNCNGIDENCSGAADEGYVTTPTTCGVGICVSTGQLICQNGFIVNTCVSAPPQTEGPVGNATCSDIIDNDCDGYIDLNDSGCKLPDLTVTSVAFTPAKVIRGNSITVTATTINKGKGPAGESTTNYYLSKDNLKSKKDILLALYSVSALDATASSSGNTYVMIPANTRPGKFYILACADDTTQVVESKEKNNCRASGKMIRVKK